MSIVAEKESALISKTKELCEVIVSDPNFLKLQAQVERFLGDDSARLQYQSVHERGQELNQKQRAGIELSRVEVRDFEAAREALFENKVAREFLEAQRELENIQQEIGKYVSTTIELGRVPTDEEMQSSGDGCCGGGCGCH